MPALIASSFGVSLEMSIRDGCPHLQSIASGERLDDSDGATLRISWSCHQTRST